jgi:hypothetical protein
MTSPTRVGSSRTDHEVAVTAQPERITSGGIVLLIADQPPAGGRFTVTWRLQGPTQLSENDTTIALLGTTTVTGDQIDLQEGEGRQIRAVLDTSRLSVGSWRAGITLTPVTEGEGRTTEFTGWSDPIEVLARPFAAGDDVTVSLKRTAVPPTADQALWVAIRQSTNALGFDSYNEFIEYVLCGEESPATSGLRSTTQHLLRKVKRRTALPFPNVDRYRLLKAATEVFLMIRCGVRLDDFTHVDLSAETRRLGRPVEPGDLEEQMRDYLERVSAGQGQFLDVLPYLELIRQQLRDVPIVSADGDDSAQICFGILAEKLTNPCFLELLWSYWHDEGGLTQTMNALTWRFQNRTTAHGGRDPLANIEIDPLRPLNNLLWGWIQDQPHRLTMTRRAYEYDHHYGLVLTVKAGPPVRGADSRSRFVEAFHNLLALCSVFYVRDDDTTVIADGFSVLNALKETHLLLSQGAHNQFGDLPSTARQEMLMLQWILARPEVRDFLPTRTMVAHPEPWMSSVEAMNRLQGWSDTPTLHFRDLAVFGEQLLLGIRFGAWTTVIEPEQAANWARYWRSEVQGYIHAYRAVTGIDLAHRTDSSIPAFHLRRRHSAYRA